MLSDSSDDARFVTRTMTKSATTTRWERFSTHARASLTFVLKRTHERTAHPTTPPRLINTECLACRASLLAFTRVVRATSKKIKRTGVQRDDDDVPATRAILFVVIEK